MSQRLLVLVGCLWLAGCPAFDFGSKDDDGKDGSSSKAAALALTKAATFTGGSLEPGLIPESTLSDVQLVSPEGAADAIPGEATLLPFEVDNPHQADDAVVATLMQFSGAEDHFEIPLVDPQISGETHVSGSVELTLDDSVCEDLCNQKFSVKLKQAVKTDSGGIGAQSSVTLQLDCTQKGNPDLCPKGNDDAAQSGGAFKQDAGPSMPGGSSSAGAGSLPNIGVDGSGFDSVFAKMDQITNVACSCNPAMCQGPNPGARACLNDVFSRYSSELMAFRECMDNYFQEQLDCVTKTPDCTATNSCEILLPHTGDSPEHARCGDAPPDVQPLLDACGEPVGGTSTGGLDAGVPQAGSGAGAGAGGSGAMTAPDGGVTQPVDPACLASAACSGSGGTCTCQVSCSGTKYQMACSGSTCMCMVNDKPTLTFDGMCPADVTLTSNLLVKCAR